MINAVFMDLIWWVLCPLAILFALWALQDCLRSDIVSGLAKFAFCLAIILVPVWGGIIWFRWKDQQHAGESALMRRVMRRRGLRN